MKAQNITFGSRNSLYQEQQNYSEMSGACLNLPLVVDSGQGGEWFFMVLEYVGYDLSRIYSKFRLQYREIAALTIGMVRLL